MITTKTKALRDRSPEEWQAKIKKLKGGVRNRVACLVWWDYFGATQVSERSDHLDEWMHTKHEPVDDDDVIEALVDVGYTHDQAVHRGTSIIRKRVAV